MTSAPAREPVNLKEVGDHLRIIDLDEEAEHLNALIGAAREQAETILGRQLITASWRYTIDDFPYYEQPNRIPRLRIHRTLRIPRPPLQSIDSIKYIDIQGIQQTLDPALYRVAKDEEPARLFEAPFSYWPLVYAQPGAVEINFTAGFGNDPEDVPSAIRHAIKIMIGNYYENRESVIAGTSATQLPQSAKALLSTQRVMMAV